MTAGMRFVLGLLLIWQMPLGAFSQTYGHTHQIEVDQHPFDNSSRYITSEKFEKEFDYRKDVSFTSPRPNKYVAEKAKTVSASHSRSNFNSRQLTSSRMPHCVFPYSHTTETNGTLHSMTRHLLLLLTLYLATQ